MIEEETMIKEAELLPKKKVKSVIKKKPTRPIASLKPEEVVFEQNFMDTISQKIDAYTKSLHGSETIQSSNRGRSNTPFLKQMSDFMEFKNDISEGDFYKSSRKHII